MKIYVDKLPIKVGQRVIHFEDGKLNCVELMFEDTYEPETIELTPKDWQHTANKNAI